MCYLIYSQKLPDINADQASGHRSFCMKADGPVTYANEKVGKRKTCCSFSTVYHLGHNLNSDDAQIETYTQFGFNLKPYIYSNSKLLYLRNFRPT
jgi:hypothetical protein